MTVNEAYEKAKVNLFGAVNIDCFARSTDIAMRMESEFLRASLYYLMLANYAEKNNIKDFKGLKVNIGETLDYMSKKLGQDVTSIPILIDTLTETSNAILAPKPLIAQFLLNIITFVFEIMDIDVIDSSYSGPFIMAGIYTADGIFHYNSFSLPKNLTHKL